MKNNDDDSFSFDKDPGKLKETSDDLEFTFSDIPVLGVKKETKDAFSFDSVNNEQGPAAVQETVLSETAYDIEDEVDELLRGSDTIDENIELQPAAGAKSARKKIIIAAVLLVVLAVIGVTAFLLLGKKSDNDKVNLSPSGKQLTEKERKELELKKLKEKVDSLLKKADSYLDSKTPEKAEKIYKEVIELDPKSAAAYYGLGLYYLQLHKNKEAVKYLNLSLKTGKAPKDAFLKLSDLYLKEKNWDKRCEILETAVKAYPKEYYFAMDYADSLALAGEKDKALEVYKKIPRKVMDQNALMKFASLIENFSKEDAVEIYKYAGNKFLVFDAFKNAADLTGDPMQKAKIFAEAADAFSHAPQDIKVAFLDNTLFLKLQALAEAGENDKAAETLEAIDLLRLNKEFLKKLVPLASQIQYKKLSDFVMKLLKVFPEDMELHLANQQYLIKHEPPKFVLDLYSEYWTKASDTPLANFLRGKAVQYSPKIAKKYFSAAIRLKSDFSQARIELGKIFMNERKWKEAEKLFAYSLKLDPKNKKLHYYHALAALKTGVQPQAIEKYAEFLKTTDLSEEDQAIELMPLAFMLPDAEMVDKLLLKLQNSKKYSRQYKLFKARRFLAYKGKSEDVFSGTPLRGEFRELYMLDLMRNGKLKKILMMPTPKEEFPEFWKIFIMRRNNMKAWRNLAEEFLKKHKNDSDITKKLIVKLWLGQIDNPSAEKKLNVVPFEQEPLLLFMIADEYKRKKNRPKSTIRYRKALAYGRNIYTDVIEFFMKH